MRPGRLAIGFAMAALMLLAFARQLTAGTAHELIGVAILALFVVHTVLNRRWYAVLRQGRYGARRKAGTTVNLLLLAATAMLLTTGLLDSRLLAGIVRTDWDLPTRQLHALAAYWFLVLASVHLGLHWTGVMSTLGKLAGMAGGSRVRVAVLRLAAAVAGGGGLYASFDRSLGPRLIAYFSFDYWDFDASVAGFFAEYIGIVSLYAALAHYALGAIPKRPPHQPEL